MTRQRTPKTGGMGTLREWVHARGKERQRVGEQHGGIISDSVWGLERNAEVWHTRMWSCFGLVSLFSPPLPLVCSGRYTAATHPCKFVTSITCPFLCLLSPPRITFFSFMHTMLWCSGSIRKISVDFPPLMLKENKSNLFCWLARDHEHSILSRWSHCTMQLCWVSHLHTDWPTSSLFQWNMR